MAGRRVIRKTGDGARIDPRVAREPGVAHFQPGQAKDTPEGAFAFPATQDLRRHYPTAAAIIFYGSCLRDRTTAGFLDVYVLVETYRSVMGPLAAAGARLLPPNVYSHAMDAGLRAKVAVMRVDQFLAALGPAAFSSSVSARFAQPSAIVFARDPELRARLQEGFACAAATTVARTLPLMPERFSARDLWRRAFRETYAAELRPEREAHIEGLVEKDLGFYAGLAQEILGTPADGLYRQDTPPLQRRIAAMTWFLRRAAGKTLNGLRLIKAAFTFKGGLDYAAWKIGRHSGVEIPITAEDRKRPLRAGLRLFAQTLRRGGIR
jgi:hypothetical protein